MLLNKRIPTKYVVNKVKFDLVYILIVSITVHLVSGKYQELLPEMPLPIPAFIGTSISILLSFKISQSYERWWEARKIWGSIVNDSRSLVVQLKSFTNQSDTIRRMALRQIAWCHTLGKSLRGLDPMGGVQRYLSSEDFEEMKRHKNKPLSLIDLHGKDLKKLREENQLDIFAHVQLDNTLVRLCDAQGRAERIKSTVFPVTYRVFLHAIIYLFVITLSLSFRDIAWYFEIPLMLLISAPFFLLEKSATHMQDPFENRPTDTAMTTIAQNIEINIRQLLDEKEVPQPQTPETFYIL